MMKRFTLTPQPRKSIKTPVSSAKPTPFPRMSLCPEDAKSARNVRDKAYKQACVDNITSFLSANGYEGLVTSKTLTNPSNREFQSILKFVYSFIDSTLFTRFEDDIINALKMLKYPHTGEVTRSQLATVTPHAWPVLLSMISWLVDLVRKSNADMNTTASLESEFYEFVCDGYARFMVGNEDDGQIEEAFVARMACLHSKEYEEIENLKKEAQVLEDELQNTKQKFVDMAKLEAKKKKINEDLNTLIHHEKQLEAKRCKYIASIETIADDIARLDAEVDKLIETKNDLEEQISKQKINPDDIRGMNVEKVELLKELERLKPERERLMKMLKDTECAILERLDENESIFIDVSSLFRETTLEKDLGDAKTLDTSIITALDTELSNKKEALVNYEMNMAALEEKATDKEAMFKDLEALYNHSTAKLQTTGAIYVEKKEISDRSIQKNRNEMDKLDNDLLKLKLENDSALLKSEKDHSETKIKLDILLSNIAREQEEINKTIWGFCNGADFTVKALDCVDKEIKKLIK